jgi:hypothetical protein
MDLRRAHEINMRLCTAYNVAERSFPVPFPDLADVSLEEAFEAARLVAAAPAGGTDMPELRILLRIPPAAIPRVMGMALSTDQSLPAPCRLNDGDQRKFPTIPRRLH